MKYKFIALAISAVVIGIGLTNIIGGKGLNTGVDFAGGTLVQIRFKSVFPIEQLRHLLRHLRLTGMRPRGVNPVVKADR